MLRRFSIDFAVFSACLDAALLGLALFLAVQLRPGLSGLAGIRNIPSPYTVPAWLYPLFVGVWMLLLGANQVYDGRRNLRLWRELASLALGSFLALTILAGILFLSYRELSRALFLFFFSMGFPMLIAWRLLLRLGYSRGIIAGAQPRNILIVGAGILGREVEREVRAYHELGLRLVGFLDDDQTKRLKSSDILGGLDNSIEVVKQNNIDEVVIALPPRAYERVFRLVAELHSLPVRVWIIPDYFDLALHRMAMEEFAGIPMLDLRAPAISYQQRVVKRLFDLLVVLLCLPFALPLMALAALGIRLEGNGPVLFRQPRVGENGRVFQMLKFRTMVPEAEKMRQQVEREDENGNLVHKRPDDPRVTRVGRILRRTSLDELPNLWNILKGEMSLVGPRPELPHLVDRYQPWQRKRFSVPQGLTGWWQVNGRSTRPMHLNTEDDLYYIQNYSLWLDVLILFKTIGVVVRGKGAY